MLILLNILREVVLELIILPRTINIEEAKRAGGEADKEASEATILSPPVKYVIGMATMLMYATTYLKEISLLKTSLSKDPLATTTIQLPILPDQK